MKSRTVIKTAMLALFVAASQPSWAGDNAPKKNGPILTAKEAKALIATAETATDHQKLAQYFNGRAGQFEADATNHDEMIEAYRKSMNPTPWAIQRPGGVGTIAHCESLAKSDREMAKALRETAAAHEVMAKEGTR